ncbi:MAG: hypothetical protein GX257_06465 [Clostridiales bacterium]|jgi:hypothetical protein|nr:hypothetical protein [Clostridiales bacterium]
MNVGFKRNVSLLMAMVMCLALGGWALAAELPTANDMQPDGSVTIQWVNTTSILTTLSFDGSRGTCGARVLGKPGTDYITATIVLARKNSDGSLTPVKTWSDLSATGDMLIFDGTYYVTTGYTYRLTITATVYRDGIGEVVSGYFKAYSS